jgi:NADPH:quinone reductase-like Zn-dependent oxidoreductase
MLQKQYLPLAYSKLYCSESFTLLLSTRPITGWHHKEVALPLGSTILVTRANGYVGSHVADRLLDSGYKVHGTVRDMQKHGWLVELFNKRYGQGKFELMQVEDMARPSAFDSALEGLLGSSLTK